MDISRLPDAALLARARTLAEEERERLSDVLEVLAAIDERRAYRELGCASLYEYCVGTLRYSEAAAYRRIRAIRAIRIFPDIGPLLRKGRLTLETVALLHPYLESPDAGRLVFQAVGMRTWQVARMLAERQGSPPQRDMLRFVAPMPSKPAVTLPLMDGPPAPAPGPGPSSSDVPARGGAHTAAAPSFGVRVAFTADDRFWRLLQRARAVLRHKYPDGRLHAVLGEALVALLRKKDRDWAVIPPSSRAPKMAE